MGGPEQSSAAATSPHVLVFPLPIQGHVTSMLKLAEVLSLRGLHVTFLTTDHILQLLLRFSGVETRLSRRPGLRLLSIPDGLPADHPRSVDRLLEASQSLSTTSPPLLRDLLVSTGREPEGPPPVTCVIADGLLPFAAEVAEAVGIPVIAFRTSSACSFLAYYCIPKLIEAGELPFPEGCDMDQTVRSVPGMESFLRRRDLPSFCRAEDVSEPFLQQVATATQRTPRARGLILNTVEAIDAPVLSHIRSLCCPLTYTIGPLHTLLETQDPGAATNAAAPSSNSASFWLEDRTCMTWLDTQARGSVVYVSFGSLTVVNRDELLEFWHGLVNSGHRFLWVMRPDLVAEMDGAGEIPADVAEATKERGFLVGWAPQQEVLAHPSVGAFLTHSGWNSTLESICAGVPMICWPFFADQTINSRYASHVWRIGLDMKDTCERGLVEKMVREVMMEGEGAEEMRRAAADMATMAREGVGEGGSSYGNLEKLVRDIRSMGSEIPKI